MRILLADDDVVSRRLVESLLEKWGHDVVACQNGEEARDILTKPDAPRMAILDWMMPDISGPDICRGVRALAHGEQFYLLLLTALGEADNIVAGLQAGANDYVSKPFNAGVLEARVNAGVRTLALRAEEVATARLKALMATAGAAAHEINQPLTIILGSIELWRQMGSLDDVAHRRLEAIDQAAKRIRDIVAKMSDVDQFVTTPYVGNSEIVDFKASSKRSGDDSR